MNITVFENPDQIAATLKAAVSWWVVGGGRWVVGCGSWAVGGGRWVVGVVVDAVHQQRSETQLLRQRIQHEDDRNPERVLHQVDPRIVQRSDFVDRSPLVQRSDFVDRSPLGLNKLELQDPLEVRLVVNALLQVKVAKGHREQEAIRGGAFFKKKFWQNAIPLVLLGWPAWETVESVLRVMSQNGIELQHPKKIKNDVHGQRKLGA